MHCAGQWFGSASSSSTAPSVFASLMFPSCFSVCICVCFSQSIPFDSCVLGDGDSLFLQQASHLTKGIYGRVPMHNQHALLQYLMVSRHALTHDHAAASSSTPAHPG